MSATLFRLTRLNRLERQIIELLRACRAGIEPRGNFSKTSRSALRDLALTARQHGYEIRPVGATYLADGEVKLIGWLALYQREQWDALVVVDQNLEAVLVQAAEALKPSRVLPYQAVLRAGFVAQDEAGGIQPAYLDFDHFDATCRRIRPNSASARAVAYVREHGRVSTRQICATGLSRQYLSILCLKGALRRVGHGYYEVPPSKPAHTTRHHYHGTGP